MNSCHADDPDSRARVWWWRVLVTTKPRCDCVSRALSGCFLGRSFFPPPLVKPLSHLAEQLTEAEGGEHTVPPCSAPFEKQWWGQGSDPGKLAVSEPVSYASFVPHWDLRVIPQALSPFLGYSPWLCSCDFTCDQRRKHMVGLMLNQLHTLCRTVALGRQPTLSCPGECCVLSD